MLLRLASIRDQSKVEAGALAFGGERPLHRSPACSVHVLAAMACSAVARGGAAAAAAAVDAADAADAAAGGGGDENRPA